MRLCMETNRFEMLAGQTLHLRNAKGTQLEVLKGELWITQEGDRRDLIANAGGAIRVERDGTTLLHAFRPTLLYLQEAANMRANPPDRLTRLVQSWLGRITELGIKRSAWRNAYRI